MRQVASKPLYRVNIEDLNEYCYKIFLWRTGITCFCLFLAYTCRLEILWEAIKELFDMSASFSVKHELRKFGETTTVRGIPRALKSTDEGLRVVWSLAVLVCVTLLVYQTSNVLVRYFKYESSTLLTESVKQSVYLWRNFYWMSQYTFSYKHIKIHKTMCTVYLHCRYNSPNCGNGDGDGNKFGGDGKHCLRGWAGMEINLQGRNQKLRVRVGMGVNYRPRPAL